MNTKKNKANTTAFQFKKKVWMPYSTFFKILFSGIYVFGFCLDTYIGWEVDYYPWGGDAFKPDLLWWVILVIMWTPIVRYLYNYFVGEKLRINRNIETIAREGTVVDMTVAKVDKTDKTTTAYMTFINLSGQEINDFPVEITERDLQPKDLIGKKYGFIVDPQVETYPFIVPEHEDNRNLMLSESKIRRGYRFFFAILLLIAGVYIFHYYKEGIPPGYISSLFMTPPMMMLFYLVEKLMMLSDPNRKRQGMLLILYGIKTVGHLVEKKYISGEDSYWKLTIEFPLQNGSLYRTSQDFPSSYSGYIGPELNNETGRFYDEEFRVLYLPSKPDIWDISENEIKNRTQKKISKYEQPNKVPFYEKDMYGHENEKYKKYNLL